MIVDSFGFSVPLKPILKLSTSVALSEPLDLFVSLPLKHSLMEVISN
jgi:hypothetical protein